MGAYYIFSCLAMLLYWALLVDFAVAGQGKDDLWSFETFEINELK